MVRLRAATVQDAAAIAHVHVQSWRSTYAGIVPAPYLAALSEPDRALQWREWLQLDVPIVVADQDGSIVGFIGGGPIREPLEAYDAELFAIYLLQHVQRQGIGSALLRRLAHDLRRRDFNSLIAWVLEDNAAGHFYRRTGAHSVQSKEIGIGGAQLQVQAFGWPNLDFLAPDTAT